MIYGDMKWLMQATGYKSPQTLKKKILYPFKDEIEQFAYYPTKRGEHWKFIIPHMEDWLKKHLPNETKKGEDE